jgi:hypothetical protein
VIRRHLLNLSKFKSISTPPRVRFVNMQTTRTECMSQWKNVYYTGLVLRHTPLIISLLVMVSHCVSCGGVLTPFHGLLTRVETPITLPAPTSVPATVVPLDPVSLLYDAFMATEVPETPEIPLVPEEVHLPQIDHHVGVIQLCVMHAISLGSFLALWLPTTYSHFAAKSSGMWTIASIAIGCKNPPVVNVKCPRCTMTAVVDRLQNPPVVNVKCPRCTMTAAVDRLLLRKLDGVHARLLVLQAAPTVTMPWNASGNAPAARTGLPGRARPFRPHIHASMGGERRECRSGNPP